MLLFVNSFVHIPFISNLLWNIRMKIELVRYENFMKLLNSYDGSDREFADAAGISPMYISQMKNKVRSVGKNSARKIEKGLDKPDGWMDARHLNKAYKQQEQQLIALFEQLDEECMSQLFQTALAYAALAEKKTVKHVVQRLINDDGIFSEKVAESMPVIKIKRRNGKRSTAKNST